MRAASRWAPVLRSARAVPAWASEPLPAPRALRREWGAELRRRGSQQTRRSPWPPAPQKAASAVGPVTDWEPAARQQTRPSPATAQTEAGPKWRQAQAGNPSPRSAATHRRSPAEMPTIDRVPTPGEVSCWNPCQNWASTPAVPNPLIGGDRLDGGPCRETQASPLDAGPCRETQASPLDAGPCRETQASPLDAGPCRETQASPLDAGPRRETRADPLDAGLRRETQASPQPTGWPAV